MSEREVTQRRNRKTGALVVLVDNRDQSFEAVGPDFDDPAYRKQLVRDSRWVTVCDTHGSYALHPTRAVAKSFLSAPWEWCADCADLCA